MLPALLTDRAGTITAASRVLAHPLISLHRFGRVELQAASDDRIAPMYVGLVQVGQVEAEVGRHGRGGGRGGWRGRGGGWGGWWGWGPWWPSYYPYPYYGGGGSSRLERKLAKLEAKLDLMDELEAQGRLKKRERSDGVGDIPWRDVAVPRRPVTILERAGFIHRYGHGPIGLMSVG